VSDFELLGKQGQINEEQMPYAIGKKSSGITMKKGEKIEVRKKG